MKLAALDWAIIAAYICFAAFVGLRYARRASQSTDEYFLSGRTLPWWIAGTSLVATTFAADTPLVVSGWVRESGVWKNWLWWCMATSTMLGVFVFARLWRRGQVMTKAELAELRYGARGGRALRAVLGVMHAGFTNTITLCWVLLAFAKIADGVLGVDKALAVTLACVIAMGYSLSAGFWGVVVTDLAQFVIAMLGAVLLAYFSWHAVGALSDPALQDIITPEVLAFVPEGGPGSLLELAFWTTPVAVFAVHVGLAWWVDEGVDGTGVAVQRVAAAQSERDSTLAMLWYAVAHYALRPWPWIIVALLSLVALPQVDVPSPVAGVVTEVRARAVVVQPENGDATVVATDIAGTAPDWRALPESAGVRPGAAVKVGDTLARTDPERAYVTMMVRLLPPGLLGLVVASLLAAFMSTVDTHVNLAASFFTHDLYRRFWRPGADERHYVRVARVASAAVMILGGALAYVATSIGDLFTFFLAFLGGVGPVYILRWLWWRVTASAEIAAMLASAAVTVTLSLVDIPWPDTPLSPDGALLHEGRLIVVVLVASAAAAVALAVSRRPDPAALVPFYTRVRPPGLWAPVRALAPDHPDDARGSLGPALLGVLAGLALIWGALLGLGHALVGRPGAAALCLTAAAIGGAGVAVALRRGHAS